MHVPVQCSPDSSDGDLETGAQVLREELTVAAFCVVSQHLPRQRSLPRQRPLPHQICVPC